MTRAFRSNCEATDSLRRLNPRSYRANQARPPGCHTDFFGLPGDTPPLWLWNVAAWSWERDWVSTSARVVDVEARTGVVWTQQCRGGHSNHIVKVLYAYEVDGVDYESSKYDYQYQGDATCGVKDATERAEWFREQEAIEIWYDPDHPADSVVDRAGSLLIGLFAVLYSVLPAFLIYSAVMWRRGLRKEPTTEP